VDIRLAEVQKRLHDNGRKIAIKVDEAAKDWLASAGYNPAYGARPLNRTIQSEILNPLSKMIIEERVRDGEVAYVTADLRANRIVVEPNHESTVNMNGDDDDDDTDMEGAPEIVSLYTYFT
jgi:ATP-dependent Clp protease ATP-binding subunit ClpB